MACFLADLSPKMRGKCESPVTQSHAPDHVWNGSPGRSRTAPGRKAEREEPSSRASIFLTIRLARAASEWGPPTAAPSERADRPRPGARGVDWRHAACRRETPCRGTWWSRTTAGGQQRGNDRHGRTRPRATGAPGHGRTLWPAVDHVGGIRGHCWAARRQMGGGGSEDALGATLGPGGLLHATAGA